jgi:NADH-quinone oxidoreductase subunit G
VLASWKLLIDDGRLLDGEDYLKATARAPVALVSAGMLAELGVAVGAAVTIRHGDRWVSFPVGVADLPEGVVWAPASSGGVNLLRDLGAGAGSVVRLSSGSGHDR